MPVTLENRELLATLQLDSGGHHNPSINFLNSTVVEVRPELNLPPVGPQNNQFEDDLTKIRKIQAVFDRALGIESDEVVVRNYNPVLARARYERLQTDEERQKSRKQEEWEVETVLRERYKAARSTVTYSIDEERKLRDARFGNERCETVFLRGVVYRRDELKSPDVLREQKEYEGFLTVQDKLTNPNTPIGTKMIKISGPGLVKDTIYTDNFVDIYELVIDSSTGRRVVQMTRFSSGANYDQYRAIVGKMRLGYFNEASGPVDAYYLSHPIEIDPRIDSRSRYELFEQTFGVRNDAAKEEEIRQIVEEGRPRIAYFVQTLFAQEFSPENVAIAFNAVLKGAEFAWKRFETGFKNIVFAVVSRFKSIVEEVSWLGRQIVEDIAAACGVSGGFKLKSGLKSIIGGIKSIFSKEGGKFGSCGECGMPNQDKHYHCPDCSKKYANETDIAPENRTKSCNCGFKFGC